MTYGLYVINNGNKVQIDSDEEYSGCYADAASTSTRGAALPVLDHRLLFARPNSLSGQIGIYEGYWGDNTVMSQNPNYFQSRLMKNLPSTTGYGLTVYNSSSEMIFSSKNLEYSFDIIAHGIMPAGGDTHLTVNVGGTYPMSEVYCLMNASQLATSSGAYEANSAYEYTGGRTIVVNNYITTYNIFGIGITDPFAYRDFSWMIVRHRG